jgi:two-component system, OmpR family, KDP operon response regulator KdpE
MIIALSNHSMLVVEAADRLGETLGRGTILVIEDQPDIQQTLRLSLEIDGYQVGTASSAEEAVAALERSVPDVVLLDLTLPNVSGWELLARFRADERFGSLPIIVVSAMPGDKVSERSTELGATAHLTKPFDVRELTRLVEAAIAAAGRS